MNRNNPTRDLPKSAGGTTPVGYRDSAVYRSLAAVPAVAFDARGASTPVGPQSKNPETVWSTDAKQGGNKAANQGKAAHPLPIPLIVPNASRFNSFLLESNPVSEVIGTVDQLLLDHNVDFVFKSDKFKWKCLCYDAAVETRFVCRLYSVPAKANFFVLDFQRRSGDAFHFQSIYKAINFKLLKSGFMVPCGDQKEAVAPEFRTFKAIALPADFYAISPEEEKDAKEYDALCRMCTSPYMDVQREGLCAFANQIGESEVARKCLAPFGERLIEIASLAQDDQVRRLATSCVAALSVEKTSHPSIKGKGGMKVLVELLLNDNELLETRRQAGKALCNIEGLSVDIANSIKRARIAKDARLVQIIKDLQSRIA